MVTYHRMVNAVMRRWFTGQFGRKECSHLDLINDVGPLSAVCDQCVELGDTWPALRWCLIWGQVGCCEDAKNQHALKHYEETGHQLIRPLDERGMDWIWCYEDKALLDSA